MGEAWWDILAYISEQTEIQDSNLRYLDRRLGRCAACLHPSSRQGPLRPTLLDNQSFHFTQGRGRLLYRPVNEGETDRVILQKFLSTHHI